MPDFKNMTEAYQWLVFKADGPCSVIIHGNPYEWYYEELKWIMKRYYPNDYYLRKRA